MLITEPSATLLSITMNAAKLVERAARTCYKSEYKIGDGTTAEFIMTLIKNGHLSVLEHASATIQFVADRGVTHELVRHRMASYCQESTRYCNYGADRFGGKISVIEPPFDCPVASAIWEGAMERAETAYFGLLACGQSPQLARSVLPSSLKAEIVMTCNFREWLHVFALRCSPKAHPQIRQLMTEARAVLAERCPEVFDQ